MLKKNVLKMYNFKTKNSNDISLEILEYINSNINRTEYVMEIQLMILMI